MKVREQADDRCRTAKERSFSQAPAATGEGLGGPPLKARAQDVTPSRQDHMCNHVA
jgi:hypothetical protein